MDKTAIKNFAIESRKILRESAIKKAGMYGITIDECSKPIQKGADFEVYKTIAGDEIRLYSKEIKMRSNLVNVIKEKGFEQVIEETAYTWFNRLIAIRFMEVNDYLPTRVRVLSSETGSSTPDIVTHALDVDLDSSAEEIEKIQTAKDDNRFDDAFQLLFVKQCNELNKILPGLFEATNDYMELLLDISYTSDGVVRKLVDEVPEDDFNVEKEGQVEIIGWLYQYYNTELKDDTFAKLKKNIKITKERIPAATQLFTPDWIVRYMVENSLGRVWIDHLRAVDETADEKKIAEEFGWKYYLPEAEQEAEVTAELVKIRADRKNLRPQDITCIDPCCGSGHILVYMFDVLLQIYESEGISVRDAVFDILEKNIHGLDIDIRAYQLSYFALMMKGRGAAGRRFFRGVETEDGSNRPVSLNVYAIDESNDIDRSALSFLGKGMLEIEKNTAEAQVNILLDEMTDAKEYGSIINITECDWELIDKYLNSISDDGQLTLGYVNAITIIQKIIYLFRIGKIIYDKYDVSITNPPYMAGTNTSAKLNTYMKKYYPDEKSDLFAIFIEVCIKLTKIEGYSAMVTMQSWLFLQSFEKLRNKIISRNLINLLKIGFNSFPELNSQVAHACSYVIRKNELKNYNTIYFDLNTGKVTDDKEKVFLSRKSVGENYIRNNNSFKIIPGNPFAFSLSPDFINVFKRERIGELAEVITGMTTGKNDLFLRLWYEIDINRAAIGYTSMENIEGENKYWIPYSKGGERRNWYGNTDYLVNWGRKAEFNRSKTTLKHLYLRQALTWPFINTDKFSARKLPVGYLWDVAGSPCFFDDENLMAYALGFMCSKVAAYILAVINPTINVQAVDIEKLPLIIDDNKMPIIIYKSNNSVELSTNEWNSYETSWDFERHPLISVIPKNRMLFDDIDDIDLAECFVCWENECNERFEQLKKNEEELNRIFIDIYGLQDELTPEVEDKDVTVRKADLSRDIKSLISFAVGCMFGRYSLNELGLVYAGGEFDSSRYTTFAADDDAIIPITDEEYFDDDIVTRFVEFIRTVYGNKSLESNLDFIAKALGNKGNTSREVIRNYFLNDFFKDHCSTYSVTGSGKRPIYWLFNSGKQNGFKCLIYMHRYTPDTVGLIRSVYLKKAQDAIEASLKNAEYAIANTESAVDRAANTRKRDKYIKQLAEIKPYYQALSHVAMQRIDIDLDDGVKVNYAKFQCVEVGGEGEKKQTIDLLAKI
ncbi:MAG: BREX-1 system adenine-specific DNA-methyltransferase PglX [Lachnospiraceae bacterium]|nr:BREX-1 system adenine-specific DNA-methyltransferase PglX [Lachnospiraceae bacterium]